MPVRVIALTGATGFIGRRVARMLAEEGCVLKLLSRRPAAGSLGLHVPWRLDDSVSLSAEKLVGVDTVCHVAARIPADYRNAVEALPLYRDNACGTINLLKAAGQAGVRRFVYVSTGAVYGSATRRVDEQAPLRPDTAPYYVASKLCAELFVEVLGEELEIRTCIVRPSSVYGPGMNGGAVALFRGRLQEGLPVVIANGNGFRSDLVYVDDVAQIIGKATVSRVVGVINASSGRRASMLEVAKILAEVLGASPRLISVAPRKEGPAGLPALDTARARRLFGYRPRSLRRGLRQFVAEGA